MHAGQGHASQDWFYRRYLISTQPSGALRCQVCCCTFLRQSSHNRRLCTPPTHFKAELLADAPDGVIPGKAA